MGRRILSETLPKRLRWAPEQRLEFIEFRLFWDGAVNRSDLMDRFGISEPQASKDLAAYRDLAANNIEYDSSKKRYVSGESLPACIFQTESRPVLGAAESDLRWNSGLERHLDRRASTERCRPSTDASN